MDHSRPWSHRRVSSILVWLFLFSTASMLTGCVTTAGGPPKELQRALEQADSAAVTVQISFSQLRAGRTFETTTETTCEDMLKQVQSAQQSASTLSVDDSEQATVRSRVVDVIGSTATAIVSIEDYLQKVSGADAGSLADTLSSRRERLASLHAALGRR